MTGRNNCSSQIPRQHAACLRMTESKERLIFPPSATYKPLSFSNR